MNLNELILFVQSSSVPMKLLLSLVICLTLIYVMFIIWTPTKNNNTSKKTVELGYNKKKLNVDLNKGIYFKASITRNCEINLINIPKQDILDFKLELYNGGSHTITFNLPDLTWHKLDYAPDLQVDGIDILHCLSTDQGETWRITHL